MLKDILSAIRMVKKIAVADSFVLITKSEGETKYNYTMSNEDIKRSCAALILYNNGAEEIDEQLKEILGQ